MHPLYPCPVNVLPTTNTRPSFKRTSRYRNSLTPSLARRLVNTKQEVDLLSYNLSQGAFPLLKMYDCIVITIKPIFFLFTICLIVVTPRVINETGSCWRNHRKGETAFLICLDIHRHLSENFLCNSVCINQCILWNPLYPGRNISKIGTDIHICALMF